MITLRTTAASILLLFALPLGSHGFVAPLAQPKRIVIDGNKNHNNNDLATSPCLSRLQMVQSNKGNAKSKNADDSKEIRNQSADGLNFGLIAQNAVNQLLVGSNIWTGGNGYEVFMNKADFGLFDGIALGVAGVLPMLALSRQIETSDAYAVSGLNLSTNMSVLRLFGSKPKPISAAIISLFLATLTAVVEETTFRGQLLPVFANRFGDGDVLVGAALSTLLFAFLHTNPKGFFTKNPDQLLDNFVLLVLQIINGGWFATLYLATDNLAVPIVAHAVYDFYTFYKTHMVDVAGQMEYAAQESDMPEFSRNVANKWVRERGEDFVKGVQQSFYLMDTDRNGMLSPKELRIALFSYGINLSDPQIRTVAKNIDLDGSGEIDLNEYLEFVGPTGSTGKAVRNTLFGPL